MPLLTSELCVLTCMYTPRNTHISHVSLGVGKGLGATNCYFSHFLTAAVAVRDTFRAYLGDTSEWSAQKKEPWAGFRGSGPDSHTSQTEPPLC